MLILGCWLSDTNIWPHFITTNFYYVFGTQSTCKIQETVDKIGNEIKKKINCRVIVFVEAADFCLFQSSMLVQRYFLQQFHLGKLNSIGMSKWECVSIMLFVLLFFYCTALYSCNTKPFIYCSRNLVESYSSSTHKV